MAPATLAPDFLRCPDCGGVVREAAPSLECGTCPSRFTMDRDRSILHLVSSRQSALAARVDEDWTRHWQQSSAGFHTITALIRRRLTAPLVCRGLERAARGAGKVFLEAGAGTSETSVLSGLERHAYISLDISAVALRRSVNPQLKIQGDIFNIPVQDATVDVIFNVGVHEHYAEAENARILKEFHRALKPGGRVILFWPWYWAPLMILGRTINVVMSALLRRKYELYPNQYWELRRFSDADRLLRDAGFSHAGHFLSPADLFSMMVLEYDKRA